MRWPGFLVFKIALACDNVSAALALYVDPDSPGKCGPCLPTAGLSSVTSQFDRACDVSTGVLYARSPTMANAVLTAWSLALWLERSASLSTAFAKSSNVRAMSFRLRLLLPFNALQVRVV